MEARLQKVAKLRAMGRDPYGRRFPDAQPIEALRARVPEQGPGPTAILAGRVVRLRGHGKTAFLDVMDRTGQIQVYARADGMGAGYEIVDLLDLGDIVGVEGTLQRTRTGEPSCFATKVEILAKGLRAPPEKFHGLADPEIRYRQRYLDLIATPEARRLAFARAKIVTTVRQVLDGERFLEVETPVLQPLYGGATARPFVTHHNALDCTLYLRIADELYLKRLLVGGLERVYEISKDFRNEGLSRFHNPEFTMLECYQAFGDYTDMMALTERLVVAAGTAVNGQTKVAWEGKTADLAPPWPRITYCDAIQRETGHAVRGLDVAGLRKVCEAIHVHYEPFMGVGALLDLIFGEKVEPTLTGPVLVTDFPVETTPLARRHRDDPALVERFEAFLFGKELANAFTELNDPVDQRQRFEAQMGLRAAGDAEAQVLDADYVRALEHGMPPAGGMGMGIDRLTMFLTGAPNIREVILFPMLRPLAAGGDPGPARGA